MREPSIQLEKGIELKQKKNVRRGEASVGKKREKTMDRELSYRTIYNGGESQLGIDKGREKGHTLKNVQKRNCQKKN